MRIRSKLLALAAALALAFGPASAQEIGGQGQGGAGSGGGGNLSGTLTPGVSVIPSATQSLASVGIGNGAFDIRYATPPAVCDGVTNVAPSVNAAVTAGAIKILLPANCLYIPTANTTPANVEIIGANPATSIVSVADRATDNLLLGSGSTLRNVGIISLHCDADVTPDGTHKVCPVGVAYNNSDSTPSLGNYTYTPFWVYTGAHTGPTGATATDTQGYVAVGNSAGGDNFYSSTAQAGESAMRMVLTGSGDYGLYILDSADSNQHYGIFVKQSSTAAAGYSVRLDRACAGGCSPSLHIGDEDATGTSTTDFVTINAANQTAGELIHVYQSTTAFSGDMIDLQGGYSSGTFTGNYLKAVNNGTLEFNVDYQGDVWAAGQMLLGTNTSVGASAPTFEVNMTTDNPAIEATQFTADTKGAQIFGLKSRNTTPGSHTVVVTGDNLLTLTAFADDGTNYDVDASLNFSVVGTVTAGSAPPSQFTVNLTNNSAASYAALQIDASAGTISTNGHTIASTAGALTGAGITLTAAAPTVTTAQIGFGGTVAATGNCGSLSGDTGCLVINVAGTTRYVPYY